MTDEYFSEDSEAGDDPDIPNHDFVFELPKQHKWNRAVIAAVVVCFCFFFLTCACAFFVVLIALIVSVITCFGQDCIITK